MRFAVYIIGIIVLIVLAGMAYVRFVPSDPARWHQPITAQQSADLKGGAVRVLPADRDAFVRADAAMRDLARTEVLAGTLDEGRITYITRSKAFGFPDYTTIEYTDGTLKMYARLRFGGSDMGVNAKRLQGAVRRIEG